ncbi:MAG TPA: glycosyltransferase [Chloroflexota bacterium]|jgi:glycosyltransferase involved in cell wall biosynthesis|nr:glycosyltransferase [Chloroflexota bacterium]
MTNDHAVRRVLAVTNLFPTEHAPESGTFVKSQIEGLRAVGLDVKLLHVDRDKEGRSAYRKLKARIRAALETEPADLVHAMYGGVMAGIVVRATNLPTVVSICGSDILGSPAARGVDRLASRWSVRATRQAVSRADAVIAKSRNLRDALPAKLDPSRVFVIPNGLNRSVFRPLDQAECRATLGWARDRCHIFFHITPDERKRPWLAREALEWARTQGADVELHEVTGVPMKDVPIWLNASDAVLNTALFEGSPNSIKEALACNTAVIAVDVGDIRERVNGVDGCSIVSDTPAALGAAIIALCSRRRRRIDGQPAVADLTLEATAQRVWSVYEVAYAFGAHRVSPPARSA